MRQVSTRFFFSAILVIFNQMALAGPWFTGPILAPAGRTIPRGHTNLETYAFDTRNNGAFDNNGRKNASLNSSSNVFIPIFTHGMADNVDIQFSLPYAFNRNRDGHSNHIGDTALALGFQLIEQKESKWIPNLRVSVQQIFPTGDYTDLDPAYNGADASGEGSYQTVIGLNFQHLMQFNDINYLRTRFIVTGLYAASTTLNGSSIYGGSRSTDGNIRPGNFYSFDLAGEFTLTQNWVLVMEGFSSHRGSTHFTGFPGRNEDRTLSKVGRGMVINYSIAPAIEYNFNQNVGIIAGRWFSLAGRNTANFVTYAVAINAFF